MKHNPDNHDRRSIRLKEYDYSQSGWYYVTICTQNKKLLFGQILNDKMQLNDAGCMVKKWYFEMQNKYPNVKCDNNIIMPNHIHAIIQITPTVGADLCVCPGNSNNQRSNKSESTEGEMGDENMGEKPGEQPGEHTGSPQHSPQRSPQQDSSIPRIVQWFKTMTTNEYILNVKKYNWQPFTGKLWQRNYYEHIIRDKKDLNRIQKYITENPIKWNDDKFFL